MLVRWWNLSMKGNLMEHVKELSMMATIARTWSPSPCVLTWFFPHVPFFWKDCAWGWFVGFFDTYWFFTWFAWSWYSQTKGSPKRMITMSLLNCHESLNITHGIISWGCCKWKKKEKWRMGKEKIDVDFWLNSWLLKDEDGVMRTVTYEKKRCTASGNSL